jgi:hypothetical protein
VPKPGKAAFLAADSRLRLASTAGKELKVPELAEASGEIHRQRRSRRIKEKFDE